MAAAKLMNTFTILAFLLQLKTTTAQSPSYEGDDCNSTTPTNLSTAYQTNLNNVLSFLSTNAATSKGYNYTSIGNKTKGDAVYGFFDCRGDVSGDFCQFCVSTAKGEIFQRCPNRISVVLWYNFCLVRYSNQDFYGIVTTSPSWQIVGSVNVSDPTELKEAEDNMGGLIRKATNETNLLYAMDEFILNSGNVRYGLVQCSRDLSNQGCSQCLEAMLQKVPQCCGYSIGWQVSCPTCMIKYDDFMFYQLSNQTSSPANASTATSNGSSKSRTLIISITTASVAVALLSFCVYYFWRRKGSRKDGLLSESTPISFHDHVQHEDALDADLPTIPLFIIQQSTSHFSVACKLGEGGFGPVYKGTLPDGTEIAVKRLSTFSGQGSEEFRNEVIFIAKLQHRNLVRLLGCCIEENEKLLVYEYMSNSSLDFHLFNESKRKQLDWKLRLSIINGIARGLLYLHEDSRLRLIHRDLKASNVLLDHEMNPKISDFGLARTFEKGQNQANTRRVAGTYGYMAPEYAMEGLFSVKSDVFSFGVLLLEIICGQRNSGFYHAEHGQSLLVYTWRLWCEGKCLDLMDPILKSSDTESEVVKCIHIGLLCVQEDAADRPTMSNVVVMLAGKSLLLPSPNHPAFSVGRVVTEEKSRSKSSKDRSINEVTVTNIAPR